MSVSCALISNEGKNHNAYTPGIFWYHFVSWGTFYAIVMNDRIYMQYNKKKVVIHFDFWFHFVEHFSRCLLVRRDISLNWNNFSFCVLTILMIKSIVLGNVLPSSVYLILFRRFIILVFFFFAYSIWISRCNIFRLLIVLLHSYLHLIFYKVRQNILTFNFENFQ